MEPRPHERGKTGRPKKNARRKKLQWSHVLTNVERTDSPVLLSIPYRFNGATSSRTWKASGNSFPARPKSRFNGATSSRTWKAHQIPSTTQRPSSLQWSHVLTNVESAPLDLWLLRPQPRFNGATSSRTWKEIVETTGFTYTGTLQWSHVLTNVESLAAHPRIWQENFASMEPRPHERGKVKAVQ